MHRRPEVEWQIAFVRGTPPPATLPDRTFTTIDWRFANRGSLETTFGDAGSSFADVIWR